MVAAARVAAAMAAARAAARAAATAAAVAVTAAAAAVAVAAVAAAVAEGAHAHGHLDRLDRLDRLCPPQDPAKGLFAPQLRGGLAAGSALIPSALLCGVYNRAASAASKCSAISLAACSAASILSAVCLSACAKSVRASAFLSSSAASSALATHNGTNEHARQQHAHVPLRFISHVQRLRNHCLSG